MVTEKILYGRENQKKKRCHTDAQYVDDLDLETPKKKKYQMIERLERQLLEFHHDIESLQEKFCTINEIVGNLAIHILMEEN